MGRAVCPGARVFKGLGVKSVWRLGQCGTKHGEGREQDWHVMWQQQQQINVQADTWVQRQAQGLRAFIDGAGRRLWRCTEHRCNGLYRNMPPACTVPKLVRAASKYAT